MREIHHAPGICFLLLLCVPVASALAADWQISSSGYGPAKVGMSVPQIEQALGVALLVGGEGLNDSCYHVQPAQGQEGLSLMILERKLARASIYGGTSTIRTDRDIGIGDSADKVRQAYGASLETTPHGYGSYPEDSYLTQWDAGGAAGVRYEIVGQIVETIHGGSDAIRYIEGCS